MSTNLKAPFFLTQALLNMLSARANLIFCAIFLVIDRYPITAFIQRPKRG